MPRNQLRRQNPRRKRKTSQFDSEEEIYDVIINVMDWTDSDELRAEIGALEEILEHLKIKPPPGASKEEMQQLAIKSGYMIY